MSNAVDVSITIKDDENTLKKEFMCYDPLLLDPAELPLKKYIEEIIQDFKGNKDQAEMSVRAKMVI